MIHSELYFQRGIIPLKLKVELQFMFPTASYDAYISSSLFLQISPNGFKMTEWTQIPYDKLTTGQVYKKYT